MFGLTIIKTKTLRNLRKKIKDQESTIAAHEKTITGQKKHIEDITPKRGPGGRFVSISTEDTADVSGTPV